MSGTKEAIIKKFEDYISSNGGRYSEWYVGITSDIDKRLFSEHNAKNTRWIWDEATSASAAREIEEHFINILGTKGASGGGDEKSKFVYAYKITSTTIEQ